jgi:rhamnosyltransferase
MEPDVTIIIPTYQGKHWLRETLPAIRHQAYSGKVEILAVDSASTDGTVEQLQQWGARVIGISQAEFSHGYARNLAVQHASNEILLFMSQDVLPIGNEWLRGMVHLLDDADIAAAHVQQVPRTGATPLEQFFHQELYPPTSKRYTWQPGQSMMLDQLFFSNVCSITYRGLCLCFPFSEDIIMSEDQVFAKSLLQAGYDTLYSADVQVFHSHHYTLKQLFRRNFDSAYSLRDITDDTLLSSARDGLRFIVREAAFLVRGGHWRWLGYLPLYEGARIAGRILGGAADYLPRRWRIRLSMHRHFWTRIPSKAEPLVQPIAEPGSD